MFAGLAKICLAGLQLVLTAGWQITVGWMRGSICASSKNSSPSLAQFSLALWYFSARLLLHVDEVRDVFDLVKRKSQGGAADGDRRLN